MIRPRLTGHWFVNILFSVLILLYMFDFQTRYGPEFEPTPGNSSMETLIRMGLWILMCAYILTSIIATCHCRMPVMNIALFLYIMLGLVSILTQSCSLRERLLDTRF
jgi:hypothetical protein